MESVKRKIIKGNVIVLIAWPIGFLVGKLFSIGQDAAGSAMGEGIGLLLILAIAYISVTVMMFMVIKDHWKELNKPFRIFALLPTLPCALGVISFAGLVLLEVIAGI